MLFAEARRQPDTPMPRLSERISFAILRATDATALQLGNLPEEVRLRLWSLTSEHLPRPLFDKYASRLPELPWE